MRRFAALVQAALPPGAEPVREATQADIDGFMT